MTPAGQPDDPDLLRALLAAAREERDENYRQLIESQEWINSILQNPAYRTARRAARLVTGRRGKPKATDSAGSTGSSTRPLEVIEFLPPDLDAVLVDAQPLDESRRSGIARVTTRLFQELHRATGGRTQLVRPVDGRLCRDTALETELLAVDPMGPTGNSRECSGPVPPGLVSACVTPGPLADQWWSAVADYRRSGHPYLHIVHDLLPITTPEFFDRNLREYFPLWLEEILARADIIMTDSHATLDDLLAWSRNDSRASSELPPVSVLPLGADLPAAGGTARERALDRAAAALVLVVGTIEPRKGVEVVLDVAETFAAAGEATEHSSADRRAVEFILLGGRGWIDQGTLARLEGAVEAGVVTWLNNADDATLAELYRGCDLLLAPSRAEGYGLPIVEAQTYGLPVLARDIAVFREVGGEAAAYFGSDAELAGAIRVALDDPPQPQDATMLPSWADSAQALLDALALVSGVPGRPAEDDTLAG